MLSQRLTVNENDQSGTLTIRADPGNLPELIALAEELGMRSTVTTEGTIYQLTPPPPDPS